MKKKPQIHKEAHGLEMGHRNPTIACRTPLLPSLGRAPRNVGVAEGKGNRCTSRSHVTPLERDHAVTTPKKNHHQFLRSRTEPTMKEEPVAIKAASTTSRIG
uniref:Uncharacterized protein n=1 Tax=Gossypium raimondii TaxID=29730 RepID=A0A0D2S547_GOSRA|nr:hypothetical protein B456_004G239700 [Gossypium raimondii]